MSEDPRDKAAALAEGMGAAGALIENLEQEVADLRSDLDQAAGHEHRGEHHEDDEGEVLAQHG